MMLPNLNTTASEQESPTKKAQLKYQHLLDYASTYQNKFIRCHGNNMILHVDFNAVYNIISKVRSRIKVFYYLSGKPNQPQNLKINGQLLIKYKTARHVVASASQVEIRGLFQHSQTSIPIKVMLQALGQPSYQKQIKQIMPQNTTSSTKI